MVLLGLASPRRRWDWSCQDWPHWDGGTGTALGWPHHQGTGTGLAGIASMGWHQDGLARIALGWPHQDGTGVHPQHLRPVLVPTQLLHSGLGGPQTFPPAPSVLVGSGEPGTGATHCGAGALHDGGFGHCCFGGGHRHWGALLCCWPGSQSLAVHQLLSSPQISKAISCLEPFEEEITQNPKVSLVCEVAWPDWKGKSPGGQKGCAQPLLATREATTSQAQPPSCPISPQW